MKLVQIISQRHAERYGERYGEVKMKWLSLDYLKISNNSLKLLFLFFSIFLSKTRCVNYLQ